jgi:1-acyl-sn-glycerol-3-phosphate acyltransferase
MENLTALKDSIGVFSKTYQYLLKSRSNPHSLSDLKRQWAAEILKHLKVHLTIQGSPSDLKPLIYVGNHISYLDIPLLLSVSRDISFLAKDEIASWPVFGAGAKALDTIFVKREKSSGRKSAREALRMALLNQKRIVMFPSGTTCLTESKEWRYGAFQVAQEVGARIQPFRLRYTPLRQTAYIDDDFFPAHLFRLVKEKEITATLEFHEPIIVTDPAKNCSQSQTWARALY